MNIKMAGKIIIKVFYFQSISTKIEKQSRKYKVKIVKCILIFDNGAVYYCSFIGPISDVLIVTYLLIYVSFHITNI